MQAGVGGEATLSSSILDGARQGGKEEVTGKSNRGVRGMDSELRGVLLALGVLEPSEGGGREKRLGERVRQ